ncbi:uncharacterized protein LOC100838301 isoform X2 [Brachypodium distachyon]|uniref:NAC domain-containing protein n=1 Tax=Brachypodium distachyon TaxID=15368 RepID=A0A2K2CWU1_BRADI|nr:uncharacterized protein LOC100838301 isoform X2 [Brachypodium distachyon]PNT66495.1 hypothetical protein BRADI_3g13117v3 [Brachypodium distachyon]|eukprot:XP_014755377.1 uncharacterized protein LOC100838301 isoform X2 [Brachypodium distachyon]
MLAVAMEEQSSSASWCNTAAVPPGFRFHPTEEELVGYYLARKVQASSNSSSQNKMNKMDVLDIIQEVDLYRIEPWDLQERCGKYGGGGGGGGGQEDPAREEYYFFSYKDRKYPSGTRTNRATAAGFWKATGRDKPVMSSLSSSSSSPATAMMMIGMRKTLVFYRGRAPNGRKTDWIIHEYRLQSNQHAPTQEEGWVVCRAFVKPLPNQQQRFSSSSYGGSGYPMMNGGGGGYGFGSSYYYSDNYSPSARLMVAGGGAPPHDEHHHGVASAAESKQQVQHFSSAISGDMPPPLRSPTTLNGACAAASTDEQLAMAAGTPTTVDWNLWSSLLQPPSTPLPQLFHGQPPPAAAPTTSSSKNN